MHDIGFIGFGSMGSMLAQAFIRTQAVQPGRLVVYNRSPQKYAEFHASNPGVTLAKTIQELAGAARFIFVCVSPGSVKEVLKEIEKSKGRDAVVVSLAASVSLDCLSSIVGGRVSRIIPNIAAEVDAGVFLACHGKSLDADSVAFIESLLSHVGTVYPIPEDQIELYTDITSCGPGLFSEIFRLFLESAKKSGPIDEFLAHEMLVDCLYGTTRLYKERGMDFGETVRRVARKGGVTEVGISVIADRLPEVFDDVFRKTLENHAVKRQRMAVDYGRD